MPSVRFEVCCETDPGERVLVAGSDASLGLWDPQQSNLELGTGPGKYPWWSAARSWPTGTRLQWKVVILRPDGRARWEDGIENRVVDVPEGSIALQMHFGLQRMDLLSDMAGLPLALPVLRLGGAASDVHHIAQNDHIDAVDDDESSECGSEGTSDAKRRATEAERRAEAAELRAKEAELVAEEAQRRATEAEWRISEARLRAAVAEEGAAAIELKLAKAERFAADLLACVSLEPSAVAALAAAVRGVGPCTWRRPCTEEDSTAPSTPGNTTPRHRSSASASATPPTPPSSSAATPTPTPEPPATERLKSPASESTVGPDFSRDAVLSQSCRFALHRAADRRSTHRTTSLRRRGAAPAVGADVGDFPQVGLTWQRSVSDPSSEPSLSRPVPPLALHLVRRGTTPRLPSPFAYWGDGGILKPAPSPSTAPSSSPAFSPPSTDTPTDVTL